MVHVTASMFESHPVVVRRSLALGLLSSRRAPLYACAPVFALVFSVPAVAVAQPGGAPLEPLPPPDAPAPAPVPTPTPVTPPPPPSQPIATGPSASTTPSASATCNASTTCGCACLARCCHKSCGCREEPKVTLSIVGAKFQGTSVAAGPATDTAFGAAIAGTVDSYALDGTTHGWMQFAIGGGEAGFDGALAGTIDVGYRVDVSEKHGPFGRVGFDGRIQGNDLLFFSHLEIPRLTLGYQYLDGKTVLEAGLRGGPIITGRLKPGVEGRRSLSRALEWGGFVAAQYDLVRADVSFMRAEARQTLNETPVDIGQAKLCLMGSKFGGCFDGMIFRGDADMGPAYGGIRSTTSMFLGVTIGVVGW